MLNVVQRIAMLVVLLLMPAMVWGQEEEKGEDRLHEMTPYLQEKTLGFIHVDCEHKDFPKLLEFLKGLEIVPEMDLLGLNVLPLQVPEQDAVKASGISDLYFWLNQPHPLNDLDTGLSVIVKLKGEKSGLPFINTLRKKIGLAKARRDKDKVLLGSAFNIKELRNGEAAEHLELEMAIRDSADGVMQGAIDIDREVRYRIQNVLYDLEGKTSKLSNSIESVYHASFSVRYGIGLNLEARFVFLDEDAIQLALDFVGKKREAFLFDPSIPEEAKGFIESIKLAREEDQIVVTIHAEGIEEVKKLQKGMASFLRWCDVVRQRIQTELRLSKIASGASLGDHVFRKKMEGTENKRIDGPTPDAGSELGLSWRVWMLPCIGVEERILFEKFHLDEPWDSDHNKKLIPRMPKSLISPSFSKEATKAGRTGIVAVTDKPSLFLGKDNSNNVDLIIDKQKAKLLFVEVKEEHGVIWTKPEDVSIETKELLSWLQLQQGEYWGIDEKFRVKSFPTTLKEGELKSLLIRDDGKPMGAEK